MVVALGWVFDALGPARYQMCPQASGASLLLRALGTAAEHAPSTARRPLHVYVWSLEKQGLLPLSKHTVPPPRSNTHLQNVNALGYCLKLYVDRFTVLPKPEAERKVELSLQSLMMGNSNHAACGS